MTQSVINKQKMPPEESTNAFVRLHKNLALTPQQQSRVEQLMRHFAFQIFSRGAAKTTNLVLKCFLLQQLESLNSRISPVCNLEYAEARRDPHFFIWLRDSYFAPVWLSNYLAEHDHPGFAAFLETYKNANFALN